MSYFTQIPLCSFNVTQLPKKWKLVPRHSKTKDERWHLYHLYSVIAYKVPGLRLVSSLKPESEYRRRMHFSSFHAYSVYAGVEVSVHAGMWSGMSSWFQDIYCLPEFPVVSMYDL